MKGAVKESIKQLIGRDGVLENNARRAEYNRLLIEEFSDQDPVFDLAACEATDPHGMTCFAASRGQQIPFMCQSYSCDGGHLNTSGRKEIAKHLLITLAQNQPFFP